MIICVPRAVSLRGVEDGEELSGGGVADLLEPPPRLLRALRSLLALEDFFLVVPILSILLCCGLLERSASPSILCSTLRPELGESASGDDGGVIKDW